MHWKGKIKNPGLKIIWPRRLKSTGASLSKVASDFLNLFVSPNAQKFAQSKTELSQKSTVASLSKVANDFLTLIVSAMSKILSN